MRLSEEHYSLSPYERRKRSRTLEALPKRYYECAFEPGCAYGHLTELLLGRCASILACDMDEGSVARARARLRHHPGAHVERRSLPSQWPEQPFDLIVLSEFLYYLTRADIALIATSAHRSLKPGGTLLACHWRHPIPESDFSGDVAHDILNLWLGMGALEEHAEKDFILSTWTKPILQKENHRGQSVQTISAG